MSRRAMKINLAFTKLYSVLFSTSQIAEKIDIFVPEEGQVIMRLVQLSQERNIPYTPSHEAQI